MHETNAEFDFFRDYFGCVRLMMCLWQHYIVNTPKLKLHKTSS